MTSSRLLGIAALCVAVAAGSLLTPRAAHGTDLQDSATLAAHAAADINDVYLFPSPANPANVVLMMTVDAGMTAAAAGSASFDPGVLYQFKISHTATAAAPGDEDTVVQFLASGSGTDQTLTMYGPAAPARAGSISTVVASDASAKIPFNRATTLSVADDASPAGSAATVRAFAGPISDPSYFDLSRFFRLFPDRSAANHVGVAGVPAASATSFGGFAAAPCDTTPAANFFGGLKALAIVVEMPRAFVQQVPGLAASSSRPYVHLWATTSTVNGS